MKKIFSLIFIAVIILIGCTKEEEIVVNESIANITITEAQEELYEPVLSFAGIIHPWKEANCGSVMPGKVEKIYVEIGDTVQKDQLLAELSGELLAQAEIEYKIYKKDFERVERLWAKGSVSEVDYDHLKAEYDAKYEKWQLLKKNTEIRAPFAGVVTKIIVNEGENYLFHPSLDINYSHASGVIRIMQLDPLKIEIEVNEKDLNLVSKGQTADVLINDDDPTIETQILEIEPTLSHLTRSATATLMITGHDLKPGMFVSVKVKQPVEQVITISRKALIQLTGTGIYYVYEINNNEAVRSEVEVVQDLGEKVVVKGLEAGKIIALAGKQNLSNGAKVSIQTEE